MNMNMNKTIHFIVVFLKKIYFPQNKSFLHRKTVFGCTKVVLNGLAVTGFSLVLAAIRFYKNTSQY